MWLDNGFNIERMGSWGKMWGVVIVRLMVFVVMNDDNDDDEWYLICYRMLIFLGILGDNERYWEILGDIGRYCYSKMLGNRLVFRIDCVGRSIFCCCDINFSIVF